MTALPISESRALIIARSHHCTICREYSWKRVLVKRASDALRKEFNEEWHASLICGVCGTHQELGIDDDGDVIYVS